MTIPTPGDDFVQDRHADLDAGENGGALTDADYYDRTSGTCRTCNDTGIVQCAEQDGAGMYEQACPEKVHDGQPRCAFCGSTTGTVLCDGCKFETCRKCNYPCACGGEDEEALF